MSKASKKRRIWIPILAVVLAAALVAGGVAIWRSATGKAVAVYPVMNIYDTYWGDDISLSGNVSTGSVQNVALRDSLIESINVQVGDTVSAGDVLMVYDTTSFELTPPVGPGQDCGAGEQHSADQPGHQQVSLPAPLGGGPSAHGRGH